MSMNSFVVIEAGIKVRLLAFFGNDLTYNIISYFHKNIENIFFEISLPNSNPTVVVAFGDFSGKLVFSRHKLC